MVIDFIMSLKLGGWHYEKANTANDFLCWITESSPSFRLVSEQDTGHRLGRAQGEVPTCRWRCGETWVGLIWCFWPKTCSSRPSLWFPLEQHCGAETTELRLATRVMHIITVSTLCNMSICMCENVLYLFINMYYCLFVCLSVKHSAFRWLLHKIHHHHYCE